MLKVNTIKHYTLSAIMLALVAGCGGGGSSSSSESSAQPVTPTPSTNTAPIANAGQDQTITLGEPVVLSASDSSDADGDNLSFQWSISSAPNSSSLTLSDPSQEQLNLVPDQVGNYTFSLVVNDGTIDSETDQVMITVNEASDGENRAPVANLGTNQTVNVEDNVTISAEASNDPDGDTLTFSWSILNKPEGSQVQLSNEASTQQSISFTPDASGEFEFRLTVSDGELSDSASVTISAQANQLDITDKLLVERSVSCADYVGTYQSSVEDIKRGLVFNGAVSISATATECTLDINQIPNHDFNDASASFATNVSEVSDSYRLPVTAMFTGTEVALALGTTEAVMLNGVTLDILPAACYGVGNEPLGREKIGCGADQNDNPWRYDPMSPLNSFGTDSHNAHTQPNGKYHYHANPVAMFAQNCENEVESPVIGFAADGFPIYGSCIKDTNSGQIRKVASSYALKDNGGPRQDVAGYQTPLAGVGEIASSNYDGQFRGDWEYISGSGDLDQCNGMTVDGKYGYYITDSFPWVINCFKGQIDDSFGRSVELERRSHSHEHDGETHTH